MNNKQVKLLYSISLVFMLAGCCTTDMAKERGRIPDNTTLSINLVQTAPGKTGKLVILNKRGERVPLPDLKELMNKNAKQQSAAMASSDQSKLPANARLKGALKLRFYQVNPCYTEFCFPGVGCIPVETGGDCTVVSEPSGEPLPEPNYITCKTEVGSLCLDTTIEGTRCPVGTTEGTCP